MDNTPPKITRIAVIPGTETLPPLPLPSRPTVPGGPTAPVMGGPIPDTPAVIPATAALQITPVSTEPNLKIGTLERVRAIPDLDHSGAVVDRVLRLENYV